MDEQKLKTVFLFHSREAMIKAGYNLAEVKGPDGVRSVYYTERTSGPAATVSWPDIKLVWQGPEENVRFVRNFGPLNGAYPAGYEL